MRSDATGEVLGRHHCLERLGEGPLGVSYRARVYGAGGFAKEFALTRVHRELSDDPAVRARLVTAANRAAQLSGDRLQQLYEIDVVDERFFLVGELVDGVELGVLIDLLRAGGEPFPVPCATVIALELAEALASAHSRTELAPTGVQHLGVSPRTVVIEPGGEVRLLQCGLYAALVAPGWDPRRATRAFLAPEVLAGETYGPSADVFSIGALLHEMVGFQPEAESLRPIVKRATDPDPAKRFPSVGAVAGELERDVDRRLARDRLALLAARYGVVATRRDAPTQVLGPLRSPPPRQPDWETAELDQLPTNVLDDDRPRVTVLGEHISSPLEKLPLELPRMPLVDRPVLPAPLVDARAPAPQLPAPTTLPLEALRVPDRRPRWTWALIGALLASAAVFAWKARTLLLPSPSTVMALDRQPASTRPFEREREPDRLAPTKLTIASQPPGARVVLDGADVGVTPVERTIAPGEHRLVLLGEGQALVRDRVRVPAEGARLSFALVPATLPPTLAGEAGLKVRCRSSGLRIFVDEADTGRACPNDTRIDLVDGEHRLQLYDPIGDRMIEVHKRVHLGEHGWSTRVYLEY